MGQVQKGFVKLSQHIFPGITLVRNQLLHKRNRDVDVVRIDDVETALIRGGVFKVLFFGQKPAHFIVRVFICEDPPEKLKDKFFIVDDRGIALLQPHKPGGFILDVLEAVTSVILHLGAVLGYRPQDALENQFSKGFQVDGIDDVSLVPSYSDVLPGDVSLDTQLTTGIRLRAPLISAAMDTVTEARLAIAMAQEGGIGVIHKNMTLQQQAEQVTIVKKYEAGVIKDPFTVSPDTTIREVLELTHRHNISGVPVVDGDELVGIVTSRDMRFERRLEDPVRKIMTGKKDLVTVNEDASQDEVLSLLHKHRIKKVLVVNDNFELRGLITVKDIQKSTDFPNAAKDEHERLLVAAAVGVGGDTEDRVAALVDAHVDVIVCDTAHGHTKGVIDRVRWIKQQYPDARVIGLDADPHILEIAREKAIRAGVEIEFLEANAADIPLQENSVQRVVSSLFFHHLLPDSKAQVLAEVFRVLEANGEMHISDWGKPSNGLMRAMFFFVQLLDGFACTRDNVAGRLPGFVEAAGARQVHNYDCYDTVLGTLRLLRATK